MATQATLPVTSTYAPGASPPIAGAPPIPTFVFSAGQYPAQDITPPTDSAEVQEWMKELDGFDIPDFSPTVDGSCVNDTTSASQAASRGWWTCGAYTRVTDIVACPDKMTWGVSFDDGPSPYTQKLLNYLTQKSLLATFFVVGSRVVERPNVLLEEYMAGHEISVHTWSHRHLTALSTEGVVAELGWTRKAIQAVLGVTPTTMRPPYGDIDDRVRAISLAMGMTPIIWTSGPNGPFDTFDWKVAGGIVKGTDSFQAFENILTSAANMNTGFIVLEHDLFEITVDLATGYTLDAALNSNPPFKLLPIGTCSKMPPTDLYLETTTNETFPYTNHTSDVSGTAGTAGTNSSTAGRTNDPSGALNIAFPVFNAIFAVGLAVFSGFLL
jgi:peptidoglycan/xylan/chitin deacetylase (PgdA/CDA1 family)